MGRRKKEDQDLRKHYTIILQIGLVVTLTIFLVAFKVDLRSQDSNEDLTDEQEVVKMKEIVQTKHQKKPPPPPRPQVPQEVPNDEIVEDRPLNINAEINMDQKLDVPDPPEDEGEEEEKVFVVVEQEPELIGGLKGLQQKIEYPDMARKAGIEGRVYLQFIVNKNGEVENPKVVRGIGGGCDKEALRVIKQANFKPGRQRGKPVRVRYSLPIVFQLQN